MKRKLIIHVGMGKTGSSSIQKTLRLESANLEANGVKYLGLMLEHVKLVKPYTWQKTWGWSSFLENEEKASLEMVSSFKEINQLLPWTIDTLVWSNESLFDSGKNIESVIVELAKMFDLEVVGYIRRPDSWITSAYLQWGIKHKSYDGPLQHFHVWAKNRPYVVTPHIKLWENLISKCRFYNFDEIGDVTKNFVTNYLPESLHNLKLERENDTPSSQALAMFAYYNGFYHDQVLPEDLEPLLKQAKLYDVKFKMPVVNNLMPNEKTLTDYINENDYEIKNVNSYLENHGDAQFDLDEVKYKDYTLNQQQTNQAFMMMIKHLFDEIEKLKKENEFLQEN